METSHTVLERAEPRATGTARYRYGIVLLLAIAMLIVQIAAPPTDWTRAVTLALQLAALVVVVVTSRARAEIRRDRALALAIPGVLVIVGVGTGVLPILATLLLEAAAAAALPIALIAGIGRVVRAHGVTREAVGGALAIYVLVGLLFALVIGVLAHTGPHPYFAQGTDGTTSERTYFSFTTLTTTGYGDFTAGRPVGRSLAVVEMLTGQLYLVTVIGVLVGNFASRARPRP
jgi:hypothetical protein